MGSIGINVLDLPRLRDQPPFEMLVQALESLAVGPSTWSGENSLSKESETAATSRYLTSILSSGFEWFQDPISEKCRGLLSDEQKEFLWDLASQRLTERCGRSAQGELTRTWIIPANEHHSDLNLVIREPPLTGDNLGLKTWGTAWSIAQKLSYFRKYFSHILDIQNSPSGTSTKPQILELGSGTGLLGLAAAAVWQADVVLTDLDIIQDNLTFNNLQNEALLKSRGCFAISDVLDWTDHVGALPKFTDKEFEIILVSDPIYDDEHPGMVSEVIKRHLRPIAASRVMVAIPRRDTNTTRMASEFKDIMLKNELKLLHEGTEICHDDWANNGTEVRCWWSIWGY